MKKTYLNLFIAAALLVIQLELKSQVTIGSGIAPNSGALLDLKEYDPIDPATNNTTSTKGLILPRVSLTKLAPNTDREFAASIGSDDSWNRTDHIGLLVYNINEDLCTEGESIYKRPYVWDGTKWNLIDASGKENLGPGVYRFTDSRDGQSYLARNFGDAGDWMLENLAYIPKDSDPGFEGFREDPFTGLIYKEDKIYAYPSAYGALYVIGKIPSTWKKEYGILYNWHGATNGQNINPIEQAQVDDTGVPGPNEVETLFGTIRGICPEGWHVPSDREWNELEKQIYNENSKYSCNIANSLFTPSSWNPVWEWGTESSKDGTGWRGSRFQIPQGMAMANLIPEGVPGHGNSMKIPTFPEGGLAPIGNVPEQKTYGRSLSAANGGFAVWLLGSIHGGIGSSPDLPPNDGYGRGAIFWTSSRRVSETYVWARMLSGTMSGVYRDFYSNKGSLNSVRCKKD